VMSDIANNLTARRFGDIARAEKRVLQFPRRHLAAGFAKLGKVRHVRRVQ
jgi:hypothetical protein